MRSRKFIGVAVAVTAGLCVVGAATLNRAWDKPAVVKAMWRVPQFRRAAIQFASDETLTEIVSRAHFEWFRTHHHPGTGLVLDRDGPGAPASIAATGFAFTSYIVAAERGWISRDEARQFARKALANLSNTPQGSQPHGVSGNWGLYYHFLDPSTGLRATAPTFWNSELSTIDTALLIAGVLSVRNYFDDETDGEEKLIRDDATFIVDRVEWDRFLNKDKHILHAWTPETGMYKGVYRGYSEALLLYIIALGSTTHPVESSAWTAFIGDAQTREHYGQTCISMPGMPLFCYQYPQAFIDFRGINDDVNRRVGFDYYENARRVTLVHHAYAIDNPHKFRGYGSLDWGLTACDGPDDVRRTIGGRQVSFRKYSERGGPCGFDDGTIAPTAAMSSMAYDQQLICKTMRHWLMERPELFDPDKGFVDAFNPTFDETTASGWMDPERIGIDQGPIVLGFENARSGLVWKLMKRDPDIQAGLQKAGFTGGWLEQQLAGAPSAVH